MSYQSNITVIQQQQKFSYYPNLLGQTEKVVHQSIADRKHFEEYIEFIIEKANVEENYARQLHKLLTHLENSQVTYFKEALMHQIRNKIEQQVNFVEIIKTEVVAQCKELIQQQNNIGRRIIDEMRGLEWDLQDRQDDLMNGKLDYKIITREAEQSGIMDMIYAHSIEINADKLNKQIQKTVVQYADSVRLQKEYEVLSLQYNEFIDVYNTKMESFLSQMESQNQDRCVSQKETMSKLLFFEMQLVKKQLAEAEKLNEQVSHMNVQDVIERFILTNQRPQEIPKPADYSPMQTMLSHTLQQIKNKTYQSNQLHIKSRADQFQSIFEELEKEPGIELKEFQNIQEYDIGGIYRLMQYHVNALWSGQEIEIQDLVNKFLSSNGLYRLLWCYALEMKSNKHGYHIQNLEIFDTILKQCQQLLLLCGKQSDASPARKLITLSPLLYVLVHNKKQYLSHSLRDQKLLIVGDFIEAAMVESIFDALSSEIPQDMGSDDQIKKQKTTILNTLSVVCFTLLQFNPRAVVRLYAENFLKMTQIQGEAERFVLDQIDSYQNE